MRRPSRRAPSGGLPALWLIVGLSVAVRLGAALYLGNEVTPQPGTADQVSYHTLALRVLDGHGFTFATGWWPATNAHEPTAHWSFPYVLFLSSVYGLLGREPVAARVVQAVAVGVLQPWLTFLLARRLFERRVGLAAAAVVAGYAYFVYYAGALMTESFFIVAVLWSIHAALRACDREISPAARGGLAPWFQLGLALALAVLLRQAFVLCVPVVLAWVAWRLGPRRNDTRTSPGPGVVGLGVRLGVTVLVIAACILPWTLRNYRAFHQFVLLNTNAGFAFFWGNHPIHGSRFVPILPGDGSLYGTLIPDDLRSLNEAGMDRALLGRGVDFVREDPARYALLSASRVVEYVKFWPSPRSDRLSNVARVVSFGVCAPFMLAGIHLALRRPARQSRRDWLSERADLWLPLAVGAAYSLAHVLTWTLVRYRLPVDGLLLPFAALATVRLRDRAASRARAARGRPDATPAADGIALAPSSRTGRP